MLTGANGGVPDITPGPSSSQAEVVRVRLPCLAAALLLLGASSPVMAQDAASPSVGWASVSVRLVVWPPDADVARDTGHGLQPLGRADEPITVVVPAEALTSPLNLAVSAPHYVSQHVELPTGMPPVPVRLQPQFWWVDGWTWLRLHWALVTLAGVAAWGWKLRSRPRPAPAPAPLPTTRRDKRLGTMLGGYRLARVLGSGGMGVVYEAEALAAEDLRVAVKVLRRDPVDGDLEVKRFEREIGITCRFAHPGLIRVLDFGAEDGCPYLVMELLAGCTLRSMCHKQPMALEDFRRLFPPIVEAVAHAHSLGVVHRDLKSSNVIVTDDGRPVVLDFGVSKGGTQTRITASGAVVGTPQYMAPEQADGDTPTERSDQYSLGVVAFEMLAGRLPFEGELMPMLALKLYSDAPPMQTMRSDTPAPLGAVVDRMLRREPEDRFESLQAVSEALGAWTRSE